MRFLSNFHLDRLSFWLGFFAGALLWWVLGKLRPFFAQLLQNLKAQAQAARQDLRLSTEVRLGNDLLRYVHGLHLAAPLFSLDEILIVPRLLAPPAPVEPGEAPHPEEITEQVLPYLPDWPELAAVYRAPTFSLAEALQGDANLVVIGEAGSGKTVALAHLATQVVRKDPQIGILSGRVPLYVHAADLALPPQDPQNLIDPLVEAVSGYISARTQANLSVFLKEVFRDGRALLLLDGLDELATGALQETATYTAALLEQYPDTRMVYAASTTGQNGLTALGFVPLPIAAWDEGQRSAFIGQWSRMWTRFVATAPTEQTRAADPLLLNNWLQAEGQPLSPLELTLKVWGAYAGDLPGASPADAIEAYLQRLTIPASDSHQKSGNPSKLRLALEQLAIQTVFSMQPAITRKEAESSTSQFEPATSPAEPGDGLEPADNPSRRTAAQKSVTIPRVLPDLIESGLLASRQGGRLALVHPVIAAYLAACALQGTGGGDNLLAQPEWLGKNLTLKYLNQQTSGSTAWLSTLLATPDVDLLRGGLFKAARWLQAAPENLTWRPPVLRHLAGCLQDQSTAAGLRSRALVALAVTEGSNVAALFRQALTSDDPAQRLLASLGCGMLKDTQAVQPLAEMLADQAPNVRRAACLALVAIGNKPAMEAVVSALLHGDEDLRQAAAEALANHPEEGHPVLEEGATVEDLLVRRAVVSGLKRVRQPWAVQALEKMQVEDSQWVVKNAATQALEELAQLNPRLPRPAPPLTETPWLIAFAGEKGMGVAPGKPAFDLVLLALREGNEEQRLAALHYLGLKGGEEAVRPVYEVYFTCQGELREAALTALWQLSNSGIELSSPVQIGYP